MYVEVPRFKRCCCCIPLRFGLVAWGYLRIIITIVLITLWSFEFWYPFELLIFVWVAAALDCIFNVMFVVGAHLKNHKIIKVYYYYSIVGLVIYTLYVIYVFALNVYVLSVMENINTVFAAIVMGGEIIFEILKIILQVYLTLLIRSEILKLENNIQFKFVTVTTGESACTLDIDDKKTQEKVKYDRLANETIYPELSV